MESAGPTPIGRTMTNNRRRPRPWRGSERLEDRTLLSVSALFLDATGDLSITSHDEATIIADYLRSQKFISKSRYAQIASLLYQDNVRETGRR